MEGAATAANPDKDRAGLQAGLYNRMQLFGFRAPDPQLRVCCAARGPLWSAQHLAKPDLANVFRVELG